MDNQLVSPIPTNPVTPSKSFSWILLILFLISIGMAGWFYYQNLQFKQQIVKNKQSLEELKTPTTQTTLQSSIPVPTSSPDQKQVSFPTLPVVVFEPPLSGDQYITQRAEIQQKIVNPFVDYYQHFGENYLVSLIIEQQNNESLKNQYPYNLSGIMSNSATHNEALMQDSGVLSWWVPTCMGPCDYSEEFKQKYPQIVSITNP